MNIKKENLNTLKLDTLHTYFINLGKRKDYTPSKPIDLPVSEKLLKLEFKTDKLKVMKTVQDMRKEGRQQSHCIGQKNMGYISRCLNESYQTVNFKGFTFFLNPDLSINTTNGRHNSSTPDNVRDELTKLIRG
jgi:hypothetical protein